jgi:D-alanyl-lipoteichoic acid acyltransferase DltB (MBOAT superfamily)
MLFNSPEFIFVFLPTVLLLASFAARTGRARTVRAWLLAASLVFYAWWDVTRLPLLLGTIVANHLLARLIWAWPAARLLCLAVGVVINVGLLAYFKYRGFFLGDVLGLPGIATANAADSLPLGISFFTFQQLAWLFDSARDGAERTSLPTYALFVTFFPQLIAGPIVHHKELVPQLMASGFGRVNLIATMTIGGLWHGAGFTFLLWGLMHGVLLAIVQVHRAALRRGLIFWPKLGRFAWAVTLVAVLLTWVPFRGTTLASTAFFYRSLIEPALSMLRWFGSGSLFAPIAAAHVPEVGDATAAAVVLCMLMCLALPATVEIFSGVLGGVEPPLKTSSRVANALAWKPSAGWAVATGILAFVAVADLLSASPSAFLYFQF